MARNKLHNVIAQLVCTRRGWTSSVGLPLVEVNARTVPQAIARAKKIWRSKGLLTRDRRCKLHPSAGEQ
jgi:hypothetical protein